MANIEVKGGGDGKKSKPQRRILRVDFTPMVDMNMLLITFFMFCTTLSIPQVMNIAMPAEDGKVLTKASESVTVILDGENKMYYYAGVPNYEDYTSLKEINQLELRNMLLDRNGYVVAQVRDLKKKLGAKEISKTVYADQVKEIKKNKEGLNVLIKPTKESNYRNLVDVLDEMQICNVDRYTIVDMQDYDDFVLENLKTKGKLTAMSDFK